MMELKIYNPTEDGFVKAIEWNHEEIKTEVAEKMKEYTTLVYNEDQIKEAKADRAKLNKFVQALETKRKEIKNQCMQPYEDFEKKMKEITGIVNESISTIDNQIKGYEEQKKAEKLEKIKEYWQAKEKPFDIELERVIDARWLNASVSMKSVQAAIDALLEQVEKDLATLQNLPEFSFEAKEVYKSTLDLGKAIQEGQRLSDIQKRKQAEMEAEQAARKQAEESNSVCPDVDTCAKCENAPCENTPEVIPTEPLKEWISFRALLTTEDALALRDFFEARNIQFEAI